MPLVVTVNDPAVPTRNVAVVALVIAGASLTVSVKVCVAFGRTPFAAVNVRITTRPRAGRRRPAQRAGAVAMVNEGHARGQRPGDGDRGRRRPDGGHRERAGTADRERGRRGAGERGRAVARRRLGHTRRTRAACRPELPPGDVYDATSTTIGTAWGLARLSIATLNG